MASSSSSSSSAAAAAADTSPSQSRLAARKTFLRRIFPVLLIFNAYVVYELLTTPRKRSSGRGEKHAAEAPASVPVKEAIVPENYSTPETAAPAKTLPQIPVNEQRELLKWMLEEKRKINHKGSSAEKKKTDEEKAYLKELIRAGSIPSL